MADQMLMPDGSIRPTPAYFNKSQSDWTDEERNACAALQQEITNRWNQAAEYERRIRQKALELTKGFPPEFNLAPLIELVKKADALGLDLVRRS